MKRIAVILVLLLAAVSLPAQTTFPFTDLEQRCLDLPQEIPQWHPVGCEVIDCCPGCPGPPELDIVMEGDPAAKLTIDLGANAAGIKTAGNAKVSGSQLVVGAGRSAITGFKPGALGAMFRKASLTSGGGSLRGDISYRVGDRVVSARQLNYRFVKCPPGGGLGGTGTAGTGDGTSFPEPPRPTCPDRCADIIQFMTDNEIPANTGISIPPYRSVSGYKFLNVFVQFDQKAANEPPVDLGIIFAFDANGTMGSRRYVNLESNVAAPQQTNFIGVSGANSWHGAQGISSYNVRIPVMGPFVQVFPFNNAPMARHVTIWGYVSQ